MPVNDGPLRAPRAGADERITLAHGAGAGASRELLERAILPRFANPLLLARHDGAVLEHAGARLAITTDTFVVAPLLFPGGDIGSLAVHGTLNDLAMCGATPLALSCGLVIEEGLRVAVLERVLDSMARAAEADGVPIVTGDTKVVERGKGDGLFINTTGLGAVPHGRALSPARAAPGDVLLLSGPLGRHAAAVLAARESLALTAPLASDTASLQSIAHGMLAAAPGARCLRDATRGGLGAVLHEIAHASGVELCVRETALPADVAVTAVCELLGLDPLFLACEGTFLAIVPEAEAQAALDALRAHPLGARAERIGEVSRGPGRVLAETALGPRRLLVLPHGELQPRIC
jgi:hydrogenase expression/formation protein HypE